jgi:Ca2+-binding EF-hand superfamily protein
VTKGSFALVPNNSISIQTNQILQNLEQEQSADLSSAFSKSYTDQDGCMDMSTGGQDCKHIQCTFNRRLPHRELQKTYQDLHSSNYLEGNETNVRKSYSAILMVPYFEQTELRL